MLLFLHSLLRKYHHHKTSGRCTKRPAARYRLVVDRLEDRTVPAIIGTNLLQLLQGAPVVPNSSPLTSQVGSASGSLPTAPATSTTPTTPAITTVTVPTNLPQTSSLLSAVGIATSPESQASPSTSPTSGTESGSGSTTTPPGGTETGPGSTTTPPTTGPNNCPLPNGQPQGPQQPPPEQSGGEDTDTGKSHAKIGICHKTGSATNPFVFIDVSVNAVPAHRAHGDIIGVTEDQCDSIETEALGDTHPGKNGKGGGDEGNSDSGKSNNGKSDKDHSDNGASDQDKGDEGSADQDTSGGGGTSSTGCVHDVSFTITSENGSSVTVSDLRGQVHEGDHVVAHFSVGSGCSDVTVSFVSYKAPAATFSKDTADQQTVFESDSDTFNAGEHTLEVNVPHAFFQVDLAVGSVIQQLGPANSNNFYDTRLVSADNGGKHSPNANLDHDNHKVGICHMTGSEKNPWVFIMVDEHAVPAHQKHGDIIGVHSLADCIKMMTAPPQDVCVPTTTPASTGGTNNEDTSSPAKAPGKGSTQVVLTHDMDNDELFIRNLYAEKLHRECDQNEVDFWKSVMHSSAGAEGVVKGIQDSDEAHTELVKSWYENFLGREAQNGEDQFWAKLLDQDTNQEQTLAKFLGTEECANHLATAMGEATSYESYVKGLYKMVLGRDASDAEVKGWVDSAGSLGREGICSGFLGSQEFRVNAIATYYQQLLDRPADEGGLNYWFNSNLDLAGCRAAIEANSELTKSS